LMEIQDNSLVSRERENGGYIQKVCFEREGSCGGTKLESVGGKGKNVGH